jgi:hypothetical protein
VNKDIREKADALRKDIKFKLFTFVDASKRRQFIDQFNKINDPKISYGDIWIQLDEEGKYRHVDENGGACHNVTQKQYRYTECRPKSSCEPKKNLQNLLILLKKTEEKNPRNQKNPPKNVNQKNQKP